MLIFHRESGNFKDILSDKAIKKHIRTKVSCCPYLFLVFNDDKIESYTMLKYGDDVVDVSHVIPDRAPVMDKDYAPDRENGYWSRKRKPSSP